MRHNDEERRLWVMNDECLYNLWKQSKEGLYKWVKSHRAFLDSYINKILDLDPV